MAKNKLLSLPLSPKLYEVLSKNAVKRGQSVEKYAVSLIASNVKVGQSFSQKKTVGKNISGQNLLSHGNMVYLNGIYYNYRFKGQISEDQKPKVHANVVYKITGMDGNVVVLSRL